MSKRSRDPRDDPNSGPSKNQLRGLSYVDQKPAFLRNAMMALAGRSAPQPSTDGRPPVPTRPEGAEADSDGEQSEEDAWDLGRGDEAPAVVVLKEGKHLDQREVDRVRAEAKANGIDPLAAPSDSVGPLKSKGSLSFSSGTTIKSKPKPSAGDAESWDDVVKRSKLESEAKQAAQEKDRVDLEKDKDKDEKRKKKEKKVAKKKIAMLSFDDD
ncbi:hypothetical protein JCM21900_006774 [Sporobolomyces salmonicolor]